MKVNEFVRNASVTTQFIILEDGKPLCQGDRWDMALSDYADHELTSWFVSDSQKVYIECELQEEFQSMKECIDEFFGFVDEMGMSRMI